MITQTTSSDFVLPQCPQDLCFNAEDFMKDSFSVDQFLQDHRKKANLEIMRDDLGVYLKTLRSAMIELINKDYTEFISLSTNLMDLDKKLDTIQSPIGELATYIEKTNGKVANVVEEMDMYIKKKKQLKLQKQTVININHIENTMKILNQLHNCENENVILERILSEITFIQFHINSCKDKPEFEKISGNWECLKQNLLSKIQLLLLKAYNNKESDKVECYVTALVDLTDVSYVETLISQEILSPLFDQIINEESLQSDPRSLDGLFSRVLSNVDNFKMIFDGVDSDSYNFLVHCIIPQILKRFVTNVKSIFAPGNADMFHRRYQESFHFLDQLEERCDTIKGVRKVRESDEYKLFVNSWNVTIYFQLRFQNIANKLETSIKSFVDSELNVQKDKDCNLYISVTEQAWHCIQMCWSDEVFLSTIVRRLWKLTLQIISRFSSFCDQTSKDEFWQNKLSANRTYFLVYLHQDIAWLLTKTSDIVDLVSLKVKLSEKNRKCLEDSLKESVDILVTKSVLTESNIVDQVSKESLAHIRSVNDIPRHFRRTNREMPTQISSYVGSLIAPPLKFLTDFPNSNHWLLQIFNKITKEYYHSVKEVITSVQRTEESLRRFKKIREKTGADQMKTGVGDEEKIKQQIALDVHHYQNVVKKTGLNIAEVECLSDLVQIVERSIAKETEE